jgi:hypothetical protein
MSEWLKSAWQWVQQNYKWLFDGIGGVIFVSIVGWLLTKYFSKLSSTAPQGEKSVTPTRSTDFRLTPTPLDIYKAINTVTPFDQARIAENYLGIPVRWRVSLDSLSTDKESDVVGLHSSVNNKLAVYCSVSVAKYPLLKIANIGDPLEVTGIIERISMAGMLTVLKDAEITFLDNDVQSQKQTEHAISKIEIQSHSNGSHVGWREEFSGSVEPSGSRVQLFVFSVRERRYWKQWGADVNGTQWKNKCQFGGQQDRTGEYDVVAVAGGETVEGK